MISRRFALTGLGLLLSTLMVGCVSGTKPIAGPPLDQLMSESDIMMADRAAAYALEHMMSGQRWSWNNPQTGNSGLVRPQSTWFVEDRGQFCRSYEELVRVGARSQEFNDVACRDDQGKWSAY